MTSPEEILVLATRLRQEARAALPPSQIAASLAKASALWREHGFPLRRQTLSSAAAKSGLSRRTLEESLDALLKSFSADAFESFSRTARKRDRLFTFVMPGNVLGAGLHEVCQVLIAGGAILLKTSSDEPFFFDAFADTLSKLDPQVGRRLAVVHFSRENVDAAAALSATCDYLVAFGDNRTLAGLNARGKVIGFGQRASGAFIAQDAQGSDLTSRLARDVSLFEQRGCLSPHHVFVEDREGKLARAFSADLAQGLDDISRSLLHPARLSLYDAAAVRRARETARWRRLGGEAVELWEGKNLAWTVILDAAANFSLSPGYRVVYVSAVHDSFDLQSRLAAARGSLEAFAIADPTRRFADVPAALRRLGVSYVCQPGDLQSPPLDWRHGGGILLDLLVSSP